MIYRILNTTILFVNSTIFAPHICFVVLWDSVPDLLTGPSSVFKVSSYLRYSSSPSNLLRDAATVSLTPSYAVSLITSAVTWLPECS